MCTSRTRIGDFEINLLLCMPHAAVGLLRVARIGHPLQPFKPIRMEIHLHGRVTHGSVGMSVSQC